MIYYYELLADSTDVVQQRDMKYEQIYVFNIFYTKFIILNEEISVKNLFSVAEMHIKTMFSFELQDIIFY